MIIDTIRSLLTRVVRSIDRRAYDAAIAEELETHLQLHAADNIRRGMDPAAARRLAVIQLGGVQQTMERCWDAGTIRWLTKLVEYV